MATNVTTGISTATYRRYSDDVTQAETYVGDGVVHQADAEAVVRSTADYSDSQLATNHLVGTKPRVAPRRK